MKFRQVKFFYFYVLFPPPRNSIIYLIVKAREDYANYGRELTYHF